MSKKVTSSSSSSTGSSSSSYTVKSTKISIKSSSSSYLDDFSRSHPSLKFDRSLALTSMDDEMAKIRSEMMHIMPLSRMGAADDLIRLDSKSISKYIDDIDKDKYRFNFDVSDCSHETIDVKAIGNKIEVHAKKTSKSGGVEKTEEYTRSYELPSASIDSNKLTSNFYKDGILSVELPVSALALLDI